MKTECWMVIAKRNDGNLSDPVKKMYAEGEQCFHLTEMDAIVAMDKVNKELGGNFAGVFRCIIKVVEDRTP